MLQICFIHVTASRCENEMEASGQKQGSVYIIKMNCVTEKCAVGEQVYLHGFLPFQRDKTFVPG